MSSTMNDTMKTAIHGVESIREGTEHTFVATLAAVMKGVNTVSGIVAMLRSLDRDDGLAWFGLARRRPLRTAATFGVGVALGAGLGLLFAPTSGADMRRALLGRFSTKPRVSDATTPPRPAVVPLPSVVAERAAVDGVSHGGAGLGEAPAKVVKGTSAANHGSA